MMFLISNFRRVLNVVCLFLGNSPASEFYMPTFRNTLSVPSSYAGRYPLMKMKQSVPKRQHINFIRRGITQKKTYNICDSCVLHVRVAFNDFMLKSLM